MTRDPSVRCAAIGVVVAAMLGVFVCFVQPWFTGWGATEDERRAPLAGDEIIPKAASQVTRAITINAPVQAVWPWLAQIGRDRGGFYSFDLLENLVGCEMPTIDQLRPDRQSWKLGDKLWMYPERKAGGAGFATLRSYVHGRALGFATRAFGVNLAEPENGSWTFVLEPVNAGATRLLIRGRMAPGRAPAWRVFDRLVFAPAHFVMERRMMVGLKQLAEGGNRRRTVNHVQSVFWFAAFGLAVGAFVLALREGPPMRGIAGIVVALIVFQILTLGQPSILGGLLLITALIAALPWKSCARLKLEWILRTGSHLL